MLGFDAPIAFDLPDYTFDGAPAGPPVTEVVAGGRLPFPLTLVPPPKKKKPRITIPELPPLAPEPVALASLTDDEFLLLVLD